MKKMGVCVCGGGGVTVQAMKGKKTKKKRQSKKIGRGHGSGIKGEDSLSGVKLVGIYYSGSKLFLSIDLLKNASNNLSRFKALQFPRISSIVISGK